MFEVFIRLSLRGSFDQKVAPVTIIMNYGYIKVGKVGCATTCKHNQQGIPTTETTIISIPQVVLNICQCIRV